MRPNVTRCITGVNDEEIRTVLKGLDWDQSGSISSKEFDRVFKLKSPVLSVCQINLLSLL